MLQEIILDALIVVNIIMTVVMVRHRLKSKNVRTLVAAIFGTSAILYLAFAFLNMLNGNIVGAAIIALACVFFSVESYAATKWKLGELYPAPKDWFRSK